MDRWWSPFKTAGNVAVIHVDLTPDPAREARALAWLDRNEDMRWRRYRRSRPRREFCLCRAALRAILCLRLGCDNDALSFDASRYGKPFARVCGVPAPISFNVSHSGKHGLIAIAPGGRIGVDVEERVDRYDLDGDIVTVFAPGERAELAAANGDRKVRLFFSLWTMKEALIKALGLGLAVEMSGFELPMSLCREERASEFRFPRAPSARWWIENIGNDRFAAAVAYEVAPSFAQEADAWRTCRMKNDAVQGTPCDQA